VVRIRIVILPRQGSVRHLVGTAEVLWVRVEGETLQRITSRRENADKRLPDKDMDDEKLLGRSEVIHTAEVFVGEE
jgi:hypothetical protein